MMPYHSLSCFKLGQRHKDSFLESSQQSHVELPRQVTCCQEKNPLALRFDKPIQLYQKHCFHSPTCFMLSGPASRAQNRVDFIQKYGAWLMVPRELKKNSHQLFGISSPFGHNRRSTNVEESRSALSRHSFSQHGLTRARWSKKQNTFPRLEDSLEEVWVFQWH